MKDFLKEFKQLTFWQKGLFFVVIGGFFYFFGSHRHTNSHSLPPPVDCSKYNQTKTVQVTMNDTTVTPKTSRMRVCDTLVVTNSGENYRQPALGTHPHHIEYPGYEAEILITRGETFSVQIVHKGRFLIHDHTDPSIEGTIIVAK